MKIKLVELPSDFDFNSVEIESVVINGIPYTPDDGEDLLGDFIRLMQRYNPLYPLDSYEYDGKKLISEDINDILDFSNYSEEEQDNLESVINLKIYKFKYRDGDFLSQETNDILNISLFGDIDNKKLNKLIKMKLYNGFFIRVDFSFKDSIIIVKELADNYQYINNKNIILNYKSLKDKVSDNSSISSNDLSKQGKIITINWFNLGDIAYTKPISMGDFNFNFKSWRTMFVSFCNWLISNNCNLLEINDYYPHRKMFSYNPNDHRVAFMLNNGVYVEANLDAYDIVRRSKMMLEYFHYDINDFTIKCIKKSVIEPVSLFDEEPFEIDEELSIIAKEILKDNFSNGYKLDFIPARDRFKKAYSDLKGEEIDLDIDKLVSKIGLKCDNKIYYISQETKDYIKELVETAFDNDNNVIFYDELFNINQSKLFQMNIYSSAMLKEILKDLYLDFIFKRSFFVSSEDNDLVKDIISCFGDESVLTYDEIKEKLIYTQFDEICNTLKFNDVFASCGNREYAYVRNIKIDEDDVVKSWSNIENDIKTKNVSYLNRIDITNSIALNLDVPEKGIREALFYNYLSTEFQKNRTVILPKDSDNLSAYDILQDYCEDKDLLTLDELEDFEEEFTGRRGYSLTIASRNMIRVDKDTFVSVDSIDFDNERVDEILKFYMNGKITPLDKITDFSSFPNIDGYTWNKFILSSYLMQKDSFCYYVAFTRKDVLGAYYPNKYANLIKEYNDLLAYAIVEANIELKEDTIQEFLKENNYTKRKIKLDDILSKIYDIKGIH